jgi:SulP family sulfate permease
MLVALPSVIAFGVLVYSSIDPSMAAQGALFGMLGAAALGLTALLFGRTAGLITAPCAPSAAAGDRAGGGMAGSGTMGPTMVNVSSGGVTRWSGFMEGVFVILAILVLSPLIAWVPIGETIVGAVSKSALVAALERHAS